MEDKKKNSILYILLAIIILAVVIIFIVKPNNDQKNNLDDKTVEKDDDKNKQAMLSKEYDFDGKKLVLVFSILTEYSEVTEEGEEPNKWDSLVVDIVSNGDLLFKNYEVVPIIDEEENEELTNDIEGFIASLDYFLDLNGKKYLLVTNIGLDGGGKSILNLDSKEILFSYSHSDLENYNRKNFSDVEKLLKVDLSKYFKNNRKTIITNHNEIGYFKIDNNSNEFYYLKVNISDGKLVTKKTIVKKLTDKELDKIGYPEIYDSFDIMELENEEEE